MKAFTKECARKYGERRRGSENRATHPSRLYGVRLEPGPTRTRASFSILSATELALQHHIRSIRRHGRLHYVYIGAWGNLIVGLHHISNLKPVTQVLAAPCSFVATLLCCLM